MMKTKHIMYETTGTCSKMIDVTADENDVMATYRASANWCADSTSTTYSPASTASAAA